MTLAACVSPSAHDDDITECDRLVSHPSDPDRVTAGVASSAVFHDKGIAACETAVGVDPDNLRLNYLLGRVYFYDGQSGKAIRHLSKAAEGGYRQAEFVYGYILIGGLGGVQSDVCRGEELWARSARGGRLAAQVSYPHHVLRGIFENCNGQVSKTEMMSFLTQAKERDLDYYQTMLVEDLMAELGN